MQATTGMGCGLLVAAMVAGPWSIGPKPTSIAASAQQLAPSSARAGARRCVEERRLRAEHSREPTKITFVNRSGMYRALYWLDSKGQAQGNDGLNPGERKTFNTFRTHPWVVATGPGDCLQIFMPAAEPSTVELKRVGGR